MGNKISGAGQRYSRSLVLGMAIAATITFFTGIDMARWYHPGTFAEAGAMHPAHLIFGLIFIVLGGLHVWLNRWWYAGLLRGRASHEWPTAVLPLYLLVFCFMAVSALGIWLFRWFRIVEAHKLVGYVFLGLVGVHALYRLVFHLPKD